MLPYGFFHRVAFVLCVVAAPLTAVAQSTLVAQERLALQSCLTYEMTAVLQKAAPSARNLTDEQAFALGKTLGNQLPQPLFDAIKRLPDFTEIARELVIASQRAALSQFRQMLPEIVQREVDRCRSTVYPVAESSRGKCTVRDPDIADAYQGTCRDGLANGSGIARGRDEYSGGFLDGLIHGQGRYQWGDTSKWKSEVYEGQYYKGVKHGFGVWSIDANAGHPAESSSKKHAASVGNRYYQIGLWSIGKLIKWCPNLEVCLASDSRFPASLDVTSQTLSAADSTEYSVRKALFTDLQVPQKRSVLVGICFKQELLSLARVESPAMTAEDSTARRFSREESARISKLVSDRSLLAQIALYCNAKSVATSYSRAQDAQETIRKSPIALQ